MRRRDRAPRAQARDDAGFTLVEVLVTMAIATVVLLAILGASDVFRSSAASATRVSVAQDAARSTMRSITDRLRQARTPAGETSPIQHTSTAVRNDLIAATYIERDAALPAPGWARFCVNGRTLYMGVRIADSFTSAGPPGVCFTTEDRDPAVAWVYTPIINGELADGARLFDYSSDACFGATGTCPPAPATVRSVGIRLAIEDDDSGDDARASVLVSAVSLRNRSDITTP